MFEDDELPEPKPSRERLWILLAALVVVIVATGVGLWWVYRPQPAASIYPSPEGPIDLPRAEVEAKKLPEHTELHGKLNRPLTDAEIKRAIELTKHPNAWIRLLARDRLSSVRDGPQRADAVRAVAAGLREEALSIRIHTMHCLGVMNARECEAELRLFLDSPFADERDCARRALQKMGLPTE